VITAPEPVLTQSKSEIKGQEETSNEYKEDGKYRVGQK
jgi:hypothetical protein